MFESIFQSFDETADRTQGPPRLKLLQRRARPPRARRLRRAARRTSTRTSTSPPSGRAARLADRLHRLGRHRHRPRRQSGDLRRRPLQASRSREQVDTERHRAASMSPRRRRTPGSGEPAGRRKKLGYDPRLTTARRRRTARQGGRGGRRHAGRRSTATRSTPSGATGPPRRSPPLCCTTESSPAKGAAEKLARVGTRARGRAGSTPWCSPTRTHSPGPSTCAAATCRAHAAAARLRGVAAGRAARSSSSTAASSGNRVRSTLEDLAEVREPAALEAALDEIGALGCDRARRSPARLRRMLAAQARRRRARN